MARAKKTKILLDAFGYEGVPVSLTQQQINFCHFVAGGKSLSESRLLAGYADYTTKRTYRGFKGTKKNADEAYKLLQVEDVGIYAGYLQEKHKAKLSLTTDDMFKQLAAITNLDPAEVTNPDGTPILNMHMIPLHVRMAIQSFKTIHINEDMVAYEFKFYSKVHAINSLTTIQKIAGEKLKGKMQDRILRFSYSAKNKTK